MAPGGETQLLRGICTKAENETKPAITSNGRALDPGLPSRPPSSPGPPQDWAECSWLRLANWLCQSCVNQVGCCPGARSFALGAALGERHGVVLRAGGDGCCVPQFPHS